MSEEPKESNDKVSPFQKFTPSPMTMVRIVNKAGKTVKIVPMNRAKRRRLKIKSNK